MKTNRLAMAMTVAIASASSQALAHEADTVYLGLQYAHSIVSQDNVPDFNPGAAVVRFGAFGTKNLAIEGRVGMGVQDDTQSDQGADVSLELDTMFGMYGVGHFTFGRNSSLYGVLGFSQVKGEYSSVPVPSVGFTGEKAGVSYGIGADIGIAKNIAVNIEYMSYVSSSAVDISAAALGLTIGF